MPRFSVVGSARLMAVRRRLLTVGHSFVVHLNRKLAHELSRVGATEWDVHCLAPRTYRGDFAWEHFRRVIDEPCTTSAVPAYGTRSPHLFFYGRELNEVMGRPWHAIYTWEEPYTVSGLQVARAANKASIYTCYTSQNILKRYPPPFSWIEAATMARVDGWFYCGTAVYRAQQNKPGYAEKPSRLGPLGVDVNLFRPDPEARRRVREKLGWGDGNTPVLGFLGRFVPAKGLRTLMQALEGVTLPWRVLFIGGGELQPELEAWAANGRKDRVRIVTLTHAEVPAYLNALDVLCAPSESMPNWAEQFGRMLVEAFACRVAVIGSDSGEIPHVVADAGLIARERDVQAWTRAITELVGNDQKRDELAARGLERAHTHYSWPVIARSYLDFLEELSARPARG